MIEADPLTMVTFANDTAHMVMQAGPPSDLPAQVPDFVSDILDAVRNSAGDGGLGETISDLVPGGDAAGSGADNGAGAENASN